MLGKDLSLTIRFLILKEMRKIHHRLTASDLELNLVVISGLTSLSPFHRTPFSF